MFDQKQEYLEEYDQPEIEDDLNKQLDAAFFEGVLSEVKRINVFFKGKLKSTMHSSTLFLETIQIFEIMTNLFYSAAFSFLKEKFSHREGVRCPGEVH